MIYLVVVQKARVSSHKYDDIQPAQPVIFPAKALPY